MEHRALSRQGSRPSDPASREPSLAPSPREPLETDEANVLSEAGETPEPPEADEADETSDEGKTPSGAADDLGRESIAVAPSRSAVLSRSHFGVRGRRSATACPVRRSTSLGRALPTSRATPARPRGDVGTAADTLVGVLRDVACAVAPAPLPGRGMELFADRELWPNEGRKYISTCRVNPMAYR